MSTHFILLHLDICFTSLVVISNCKKSHWPELSELKNPPSAILWANDPKTCEHEPNLSKQRSKNFAYLCRPISSQWQFSLSRYSGHQHRKWLAARCSHHTSGPDWQSIFISWNILNFFKLIYFFPFDRVHDLRTDHELTKPKQKVTSTFRTLTGSLSYGLYPLYYRSNKMHYRSLNGS